MPRIALLQRWLSDQFSPSCPEKGFSLTPASSDASFRRYFRMTLPDGQTKIIMDAPPALEDCKPFLKVARLFKDAGVHVPEIYQENLDDGFLVLSDLGNTTYLSVLNDQSAKKLYQDANTALIHIQKISRPNVLPDYDHALLLRELNLFPDWYIDKHIKQKLDEKQQRVMLEVFDKILKNALSQARVYVHRDYHSRNLMVSGDAYPANPGVIDFQDAVYGPITYDLVSLYRDAYISWEEEQELDFVIRYWENARKEKLPVPESFDDFYRDYEWMGAQRQIKVLGIFARLYYRDGKENYLKDMPRVMAYLKRTCERYTDLRPFARLLDQLENSQQENHP